MSGSDVGAWQQALNVQLKRWHADDLLAIDDDYGVATRAFTARVLKGLGIAQSAMAHGVTPELRIKVRHRQLTLAERYRYVRRAAFRKSLRHARVSSPLKKIIEDSWGWHPGLHDGLDLICPENAPIYSMTAGEVVRADTSGWWGLGNPGGAVGAKGDGITIVRCSEDVGPFRKGMNVCYGHAEHPRFAAGHKVKAGDRIATAGFANAWHIHMMINDDLPGVGGFSRGVGDRDPRPFYEYAVKHG